MRKAQAQAAFTLIELLVVLAIIAILTTLLFTALSGSRMRSNQAISLNNLVQWGTALQRSLTDNANEMPSTGQLGGTIEIEDLSAWYNRLPPYLGMKPLMHNDYKEKPPRPGDRSLWINPAIPKSEGNTYIEPPSRFLFCYAMNYFLDSTEERNQRAARIENPMATVFMAEKGDDKSACEPTDIKAYFGPGDVLKDKKNGAHFLYMDGHVDFRTRDKFDPNFMELSFESPSPVDNQNLNRSFTFVPYPGAIAE